MKTILIILITGVLLFAFEFFFNNPFKNSDVDLSISVDKTDSFKTVVDINEICSLLRIDDNKWSKIKMQINTLSNFEYNTSQTLALPSQLLLFSNPDQRDSAIEQFKKSIAMQLHKINQIPIGRPNSSIYVPMIRELNRLARSKAKSRIAIFYSDLRENAKFSVYKKQDQELFKARPGEVKKIFLQLEKPDNLKGIKVYFIFEPKNYSENNCFNLMSTFFKKFLEDAGAQVYVGANLPTENN